MAASPHNHRVHSFLSTAARGTARLLAGTAVLLIAACSAGSDDAGDTTLAPLAAPPPACIAPASPEASATCLDQVAIRLEADTLAWADGEVVTHAAFDGALTALVPSVAAAVDQSFSFRNATDAGDADAEELATTPVMTTWNVGTAVTTLWACFDGLDVAVGPEECSRTS